jgi:hypothetical protein
MKEKIIAILKKHHLHHYGNFEEAVEELNNFFNEVKNEIHKQNNRKNGNKPKIIRNS